jgi:hypothetical protein
VKARLPRYRVASVTGWPITAHALAFGGMNPRRTPATIWNVLDSWDCYRIVKEYSIHNKRARAWAEYDADQLNRENEARLRAMDVL